jgi:hypothetical protein
MEIRKPTSSSIRSSQSQQAAAATAAAPAPTAGDAPQPQSGFTSARQPAQPMQSRDDRLAALMDARRARAEGRQQTSDDYGRQVLEYQDAEGNRHRDVRTISDAGQLVQARTMMEKDGVVQEVSKTSPSGVEEAWTSEDSFTDDSKDHSVHTVSQFGKDANGVIDWSQKTVLKSEAVSSDEVASKRNELFAVKGSGVQEGLGGAVYTSQFNSSITAASGTGPDGQPANVVIAQGVHGAGPFPGAQWDEASLVITDGQYNKQMALTIDDKDVGTHLNARFEKAEVDGEPAAKIIYEGDMVDEAGKKHFVESSFVLRQHEVELADPGLWGKIYDNTAGVALKEFQKVWGLQENANLLTELPSRLSSVKVDGKEYKIDKSITALDDNAKFNNLPNTPLLAANYAPESQPLLSLMDLKEMENRRKYNSTFLVDQDGLLNKIPDFLKKGVMENHIITDAEGKRRDATDDIHPDGPPLVTKTYPFQWEGKTIATMTKDLIRYRDDKGNVEIGYRETIRPTEQYQEYLKSLVP